MDSVSNLIPVGKEKRKKSISRNERKNRGGVQLLKKEKKKRKQQKMNVLYAYSLLPGDRSNEHKK